MAIDPKKIIRIYRNEDGEAFFGKSYKVFAEMEDGSNEIIGRSNDEGSIRLMGKWAKPLGMCRAKKNGEVYFQRES